MPGHAFLDHAMAEGYAVYVAVCDPSFVPICTILYYSHQFASTKGGKLLPGCFAKSLFFFGGIDAIHADANGFGGGIQYVKRIAIYYFNYFSGDGDGRRSLEESNEHEDEQQHGSKVLIGGWKSGMRLSRGKSPGDDRCWLKGGSTQCPVPSAQCLS